MPGGDHTSGLQGSADVGVGGIHTELMNRFAEEGYIYTATEQSHPGWAGNPLSHYERKKEPGSDFKRMKLEPGRRRLRDSRHAEGGWRGRPLRH